MATQEEGKLEELGNGHKSSVVAAGNLVEYGHWQRVNRLISTVLWPLGLCACVTLLIYGVYYCGIIDSYADYSAIVCAAICYVYLFCFLANFRPGKRLRVVMLVASSLVLLAYALGFAWQTEDRRMGAMITLYGIIFGVLFLVPPLFALLFSLWNRLAGWRLERKPPERRAKKMVRLKNALARKTDAFLGRHSIALSGPKEFVLLSGGWAVVVVCALAALPTAYFYIGGIEWGDWTIPDEAELRLEKVNVPDNDNAYVALMALTNLCNVAEDGYDSTEISDKRFVNYYGNPFFTDGDNDEREEWAAARHDPSSPRRAEKILADNAKFFEAFRAVLSLKGYLADFDEEVHSIWPNEEFKPFMSVFSSVKPFVDFAQLVRLKAQVALECGDSEAAVAAISDIHAFGQMVATNCGCVCFGDIYGGYIEWLVGNLIKGIAYKKMSDAIAMGKATDEMFEAFNKMVDEDEAVVAANRKRVIKAEFTHRAKCVDWYSRSYSTDLILCVIGFDEHDVNISTRYEFNPFFGRQNTWSDRIAMFKIRAKIVVGLALLHWPGCRGYNLHRRETLFRIAETARTAIAGKELRGGSAGYSSPPFSPGDVAPFSNNAFGSFLVDGMCYLCNSIGSFASEHSLSRTRIRLVLAAERWRRAHGGKNPPTLDALVPEYLAAVPKDPWDKAGGPIKYDAALGVVWSVGKDGKYDYRKVNKDRTSVSKSPEDKDTQTYAFRLDAKPIVMPESIGRKTKSPAPSKEEKHEKAEVFDEAEINDNTWRFTTNGVNATIVGVLRATGSIEIPPEITVGSNTYAVTGIGRSTFSNRSSLRSVTIPDGVKEIGAGAFCDCTRLTSVSVSCSVTSIGDGAFDGCTGLRSFVVRVPSCVTNVGVVVVLCNDFITGFSVAEGNPSYQAVSGLLLSKDGKTLIHGVNGDVAIPDGVVRINRSAFSDCCRLTRVVIPRSVTYIGDHAFDRCFSVKSFAVDKDNPNYMSVNGMLLTKDGKTLIHGVNGDATVPDGVTCIGDGSFAGHTGLTRVTIPDSVTNIACNAFYGCSGLESIVVGRNNPNYKLINGMLLTKDGTALVVMSKKDPKASTQKNWRCKCLMWIGVMLVVALGTYLVRKNKKRRNGGNGEQGKAQKLELIYVAEKSEKEVSNLFLRRHSSLLRPIAIIAVLWPIASVMYLYLAAGMAEVFTAINYAVCATVIIVGTLASSIFYIFLNRYLTNAPRRAYRRRETHKVEYRLTDDTLSFTAGVALFSSPWNKVAREFRVDKNALFLFGRDLPFEVQCVPDWQGRGVERKELISALRRAGLRESFDWGKLVFRMAVAGILVWIISVAVRSDSGKALWWRMLGVLGNAEAQCRLGECYARGEGVRRDMHQAERWYLEAVEQGCRKAALCRVMAQLSYGYNSSYEEALKHWRKAAEQGNRVAQYRLGESYHKARGVERDPVEAVRWYRYAAEGGHEEAQCALGCCYEKGEGVERDRVEAFRWYHKAASKGSVEARKKIEAAKEADTKVPEKFQIASVDSNPAMKSQLSWKLLPPENPLNVNSTQIRDRLELICDPADKVSGAIASVKPLISGGEKGFLVEVEDVVGEGRLGLSYDGCLPVYYDVKVRRLWLVPVASCRAAVKGRYDSRVFITGVEQGLTEGEVISPSAGKCGYRVLSISDRCVWFEAFYGDEPPNDKLQHGVWPDFSRIDTLPPTPPPGSLMFGKRKFWPGDAIMLRNSGAYLMVDDFLEGKAVVFRLLDTGMRPVRDLQCVIVREEK